jgi:hypothetical protein
MLFLAPLVCASFLAPAVHAWPEARGNQTSEFLGTCHKIAAIISNASQVFFPRERVIHLPVVLPS